MSRSSLVDNVHSQCPEHATPANYSPPPPNVVCFDDLDLPPCEGAANDPYVREVEQVGAGVIDQTCSWIFMASWNDY